MHKVEEKQNLPTSFSTALASNKNITKKESNDLLSPKSYVEKVEERSQVFTPISSIQSARSKVTFIPQIFLNI